MRPRHFATEDKGIEMYTQADFSFNEAAAFRHGRLEKRKVDGYDAVASMRPRHFATEDSSHKNSTLDKHLQRYMRVVSIIEPKPRISKGLAEAHRENFLNF